MIRAMPPESIPHRMFWAFVIFGLGEGFACDFATVTIAFTLGFADVAIDAAETAAAAVVVVVVAAAAAVVVEFEFMFEFICEDADAEAEADEFVSAIVFSKSAGLLSFSCTIAGDVVELSIAVAVVSTASASVAVCCGC